MSTIKQTFTTETATVTTTTDNLSAELSPQSSAVPVAPQKKRKQYHALSNGEKIDLLKLIVSKFGTSVTRKQLQSLVDEDDGRPWAVFRFIANDKKVKTGRGIYVLQNLKGLGAHIDRIADVVANKGV